MKRFSKKFIPVKTPLLTSIAEVNVNDCAVRINDNARSAVVFMFERNLDSPANEINLIFLNSISFRSR